MTQRAALFVGAVTTVLFLGVGAGLFSEGRTLVGSVIMGLGVLRGLHLLRQVRGTRDED